MSQQPERNRENSFRDARKQIVRSAFLALAALGVIVFACYAWFVSNNSVTGKISSVLLNGSTFELASIGNEGAFDSKIGNRAVDGEPWNDNGTITGQGTDIRWRIEPGADSTSHFQNQTRADGIYPGTSGTLSFYVVPKRTGKLDLRFNAQLIPLREDGTQVEVPTLDPLLRGHILFSVAKGNDIQDNNFQLINFPRDNIPAGSFEMSFAVNEQCTPIQVCLCWTWPKYLKDALEIDGVSQKVYDPSYTEWFFYNPDKSVDVPVNLTQTAEYNIYYNYFNNADQYIGEKTEYVLLQLVAEEISSNLPTN